MRRDIKLFKITCILLAVSSFSLLLSFFGDYGGNAFNVVMAALTGILFWACLIAGYALFAVINSHRKKYVKAKKSSVSERNRKRLPGIICFFSNKYAIVADFAMILFFILTLVFIFIPFLNQSIAVIAIAILLFSVHMHCILNGMNFRYILQITKESRNG